MKMSVLGTVAISFVILIGSSGTTRPQVDSDELKLVGPSGVRMRVAEEDSDATLWLSVPGEPSGQNAVLVLLPEHVTVRRRGTNDAQHRYLWHPGKHGARPRWARIGNALQYESDLPFSVHFSPGLLSSRKVSCCITSSRTIRRSILTPSRRLQIREWFHRYSTMSGWSEPTSTKTAVLLCSPPKCRSGLTCH